MLRRAVLGAGGVGAFLGAALSRALAEPVRALHPRGRGDGERRGSRNRAEAAVARIDGMPADLRSSMQKDREAGRPTQELVEGILAGEASIRDR